MSGDYSRERFDASADVSGVRMQQGRVQLDADWNEWVDVVGRRFRAETVDLVGREPDPDHQGVAVYPRQTPDAFRISLAGGDITIGRGRMYVDGLLAENHGAGDLEFDRVLEEVRGADGLPYDAQPYFPTPPALPEAGRALAYLDVWQREVTHLQDPGLVESAVGVDTTTRQQTVWQVRVLPDVGADVTCSTPDSEIAGWPAVIRPSAGRLTTAAVGVPEDEEPCEMPPSGGFRGVENHLYRVQIHDGGAVGTATFKWSRENASVASGVVEVLSANELRLESLGHDSVLRFNTGDWVEIIDDRRELTGINGDPRRRHGEIRQITTDEATRTITFTPNLPADLLPSGAGDDTADARHLIVRRWDQGGSVYDSDGDEFFYLDAPASNGVIPVPPAGTTLALESGIEITFSVAGAGGQFHSGDYWTFAARTTDASVEELDAAPPRGTHHHFARLAVLTFPDEETDCRIPWPPADQVGGSGSCCTICISAEEFAANPNIIQEAVDTLQETGGTICLGRGIFMLGERRVTVEGARSITIRGQGTATQVVGWGTLFEVRSSFLITITDMQMTQLQEVNRPIITLDQVLYGNYQRLVLARPSAGGDETNAPAIGLSRIVWYVDIKENIITAPVGLAMWLGGQEAQYLLVEGFQVDDNILMTTERGIHLEGAVLFGGDVRVARNRVSGATVAGVTVIGASAPTARVEVSDNVIHGPGTGIIAGVNGLRIDRNELWAPQSADGQRIGVSGIILEPGYDGAPIGPTSITGNRIRALEGPAIGVNTMLTSADIQDNVIQDTGGGIIVAGRGGGETVRITGNEVLDIHPRGQQTAITSAIQVQRVSHLDISHNTVSNVDGQQTRGLVGGILAAGSLDLSVRDNHVARVRTDNDATVAVGVYVAAPFGHAEVSGNTVTADTTQANGNLRWCGILIGAVEVGDLQRIANGVAAIRTTGDRMVLLTDNYAAAFDLSTEHAAVHHNTVEGAGTLPGILVGVRGECQMADNLCVYTNEQSPAVAVTATLAAAHSNRVRAGRNAMMLNVDPGRSTVVGNITSGPINMGGALPPPWDALNVVA
ncbi:MAG: right-handed parallel beta-helix repeat-containing protein [Dehalococcoidia bacterium]|nr:right-handed parallel beta-helix repeat-containing protein [Dehalococcoidia bacterium]